MFLDEVLVIVVVVVDARPAAPQSFVSVCSWRGQSLADINGSAWHI